MKLFGHDTSPYVRRARVLLAELGVPFTRDPTSWVNATEEMLRLNPIMKVPLLQDGEQVIIDSKLMAAYLYDRRAAGVTPAADPPLQATLWRPGHRYDDENLVLAIDAALDSAIQVFLMEQDGILPAASPYLQRQAERIARCLAWVDQRYAGRDTLAEGVFAFADIALLCTLDWLAFRKRYDWSGHENLRRAAACHRDRPSLAATHPSLAAPAPPPRAAAR